MATKIDLIENSDVDGTLLNLAITQGLTYQLSLLYPGDITLNTIKSQIRNNYLQDTNTLLADFVISPLVYNIGDDMTTITATLSSTITRAIPYTKYQGSGVLTTRTAYVFDMDMELTTGEILPVLPLGFVQVKPEVTENI